MSYERRRLQPWTTKQMNSEGFLCWKLEDKNRPGLPDCLIRSPHGKVSWVELKWSNLKTSVAVHLAPTQWRHLKDWDPGLSSSPCAWVLVAAPAFDRLFLVPVLALQKARETFNPEQLVKLPGVESCACTERDLGALLRRVLV